jgi:phage terminase large subunit-like protein
VAQWDADWLARLHQVIASLADMPPGDAAVVRRELAKDPIAFAVIYLSHHLRSRETGDRLTFSEAHFEWARMALNWVGGVATNDLQSGRHAIIAPRGLGKSTWWFLILPLWAAANGHTRFVAAFADSANQAMGHLTTFKSEQDDNALLRHDYPDLCTPAKWRSGTSVADRQSMLHTKSGFTFAARGIDSSVLGLKVGTDRPDILILDDIEPDESSYSALLAEKRRTTMIDAIFALNVYARVILVGTVTMPDSIMHQVVRVTRDGNVDENTEWVQQEKIVGHHYLPIITADDGTRRSIWEAKWPLSWLLSRRGTREYAKNYLNDPYARDSVYWSGRDFRYGEVSAVARTGLWVDPAVTSRERSDYTGLAVVGFSPSARKVLIKEAVGVRLAGKELRLKIISMLTDCDEISRVFVEVNQGGDLWKDVLHDLPVRLIVHTVSDSKEVRFARALPHWQRGRVVHANHFGDLEDQAVAFPNGRHDDVIDAAVAGVNYFLVPQKKVRAGRSGRSYVRGRG